MPQQSEVREEQGGKSSEVPVQLHVSRLRQKNDPLFQDQLFICMRFPECLGRTRRAVVAQLQTVAVCCETRAEGTENRRTRGIKDKERERERKIV